MECFTSESEDESGANDNVSNLPNSLSGVDTAASSSNVLQLRGLDFDSLPTNNFNRKEINTQPGSTFFDPQLARTIQIKYPCVVCNKACTKAQNYICCNVCDEWTHKKCGRLTDEEFEIY